MLKKSYLPMGFILGLCFSLWACQTPNFIGSRAALTASSQTLLAKTPLAQASLNSKTDKAANTLPKKTDALLVAALPAELDVPLDPLAWIQKLHGIQRPIQQTSQQFRVAMLVPRTGLGAKEGRDLIDAAIMALFDFKNDLLDLRIYDTKGRADIAATVG